VASAERELITGVWVWSPSGLQGRVEPLVRGSGEAPLKLKAF